MKKIEKEAIETDHIRKKDEELLKAKQEIVCFRNIFLVFFVLFESFAAKYYITLEFLKVLLTEKKN